MSIYFGLPLQPEFEMVSHLEVQIYFQACPLSFIACDSTRGIKIIDGINPRSRHARTSGRGCSVNKRNRFGYIARHRAGLTQTIVVR